MGLGRKSAWLALAQVVEMGLQVLLPLPLVRHLTVEAFGAYRVLWLIAGSAATLLPMAVPDTLAVLLPAASDERRRSFVAWALCYMALVGLVAGVVCAAGLALTAQSPTMRSVALSASLFTSLWVVGVLLDYLPVADERAEWQARAVIGLAFLRATAAGWAAWHFGQAEPVFWALCLTAVAKVALLVYYAQARHDVRHARLIWREAGEQWRRALPLGISGLLFGLRRQCDQWIAAVLFGVQQFAAFSLGAVFGPLVFLARKAVSSTLVPAMSRMLASGDTAAVLATNNRANLAVAFFALPVLAFLWCFGEPIYSLIYTDKYLDAVPVMRLLTVVWLVQIVDMNSLVLLFHQNAYVARINLPLLAVSALVSGLGGWWIGLTGAAAGTVLAILLERWLIARRLAATLQLPVRELQPWRGLILRIIVCWSVGLLARGLYEMLLPRLHLVAALITAALAAGTCYAVLSRLLGWFPGQLLVESKA